MTWTVQRRIAVGFAAVLILVMSVAIIGAVALTQASNAYEAALAHERQIVDAALEAEVQTDKAVIDSNRFLLTPREEFAAGRERAVNESRGLLERSASLADSPEQRALWTEALAILNAWDQSSAVAMQAAREGDLSGAIGTWETTALPQRQQMTGVIERGVDLARREAGERVTQAAEAAEQRRIALLIATALALLGGLASGVLLNRAVSGPLRETTTVLASSASEIMAATGQQASSAAQTSSAVVETSTTVDEVAQTAEQAAQRARTLSSSAQRAAEIGRSGREAVDESISSMRDVKERVESIADSILVLADQAQAIGEIIATVNDIADQTNILALNAAVEAARAGEQGRGFAVVAGEVRNLAEESKAATVQVRQILGEIQRATSTAVIATERGTHEVAAGTRQVEQAGETIRMLSEAVDDAAQAAAQIVASAGQQATGMTQIRQAMGSIQEASRQNLASTRQAEQAARDLNDLGRKLLRLVGADGASRSRAPAA